MAGALVAIAILFLAIGTGIFMTTISASEQLVGVGFLLIAAVLASGAAIVHAINQLPRRQKEFEAQLHRRAQSLASDATP